MLKPALTRGPAGVMPSARSAAGNLAPWGAARCAGGRRFAATLVVTGITRLRLSTTNSGPHHRGAHDSIAKFASAFVAARMVGFEKDMRICLRPSLAPTGTKKTHAYFPALAACCATLEYLVGLHRGNLRPAGWPDVAGFAREYLPQPEFNDDVVRVLFQAFRHAVMHRGIASGVWIDRAPGPGQGRRVVWEISAGTRRPSCSLVADAGTLTKDPPWPTSYTHRMHIRLGALGIEIREAAKRYAEDVSEKADLQTKFEACMRQLYPK